MKRTVSYVLALRWEDDRGLLELTAYLHWLSRHAQVVVADGSPPELFDRHARQWVDFAEHVRPDPDLHWANGKVNGVATGMRRARHEHVVIADDDVRYDEPALNRVVALLADADVVRPQNVFVPMPWHAVWDTGRSLLNRAVGADYPGTFALRRSLWDRMGGYDGDVLFENLELIRTARAYGGREARPLDLYVRRRPPDRQRFAQQRVRQAYDDWAQPWRLLLWLSVLPAAAEALRRRRPALVLAGALGAVAVAEGGRRRAGGANVFPVTASLAAPLWVLERGTCAWLAVGARARGGVRYSGRRLRTAAHPSWTLRRRARARSARLSAEAGLGRAGSGEAGHLVAPVAKRLEP